MKQNIQLLESGLKCDNPKCDWEDRTIPHSDYEKCIDKPCPKCGENILTKEDYSNAKLFHSVVDLVNSLSEEELEVINFESLGDLSIFSAEDKLKIEQNLDKELTVEVSTHKGINFKLKE
jgi:hypothetical protein